MFKNYLLQTKECGNVSSFTHSLPVTQQWKRVSFKLILRFRFWSYSVQYSSYYPVPFFHYTLVEMNLLPFQEYAYRYSAKCILAGGSVIFSSSTSRPAVFFTFSNWNYNVINVFSSVLNSFFDQEIFFSKVFLIGSNFTG